MAQYVSPCKHPTRILNLTFLIPNLCESPNLLLLLCSKSLLIGFSSLKSLILETSQILTHSFLSLQIKTVLRVCTFTMSFFFFLCIFSLLSTAILHAFTTLAQDVTKAPNCSSFLYQFCSGYSPQGCLCHHSAQKYFESLHYVEQQVDTPQQSIKCVLAQQTSWSHSPLILSM